MINPTQQNYHTRQGHVRKGAGLEHGRFAYPTATWMASVLKWRKFAIAIGFSLVAGSTARADNIFMGDGNINAPGAYLSPGSVMGHGNTINNPRYAEVMIEPGGSYYHTPVIGNKIVTVQNGPNNQSSTNPFAEMGKRCFPFCDKPWMLNR